MLKIEITKEACGLLYGILMNPGGLPLTAVKIATKDREPNFQGLRPWVAENKRQRKTVKKLRKWMEKELKPKIDEDTDEKVYEGKIVAFSSEIESGWHDVLTNMVKHYVLVGGFVAWCEAYDDLEEALDAAIESEEKQEVKKAEEKNEPKTEQAA